MITTLVTVLIAALILYVIYYVVGMFIKGKPLNIIGLILAIFFIVFALRTFGVLSI